MRLIDADELMKHVWRDKLDSRELIAKMIDNAPTIKEIPTKIPINIFEQLISQQPKIGKWVNEKWHGSDLIGVTCSSCRVVENRFTTYCPNCGAKMIDRQEREEVKTKSSHWESEQDKNEAMASSLGHMLDGLAMDLSCE